MGSFQPEGPMEMGVMFFDTWTGHYRDTYNDVFLTKKPGKKMWVLTSRGDGNKTVVWSRHRSVFRGLEAANEIAKVSAFVSK